MDADDTQSFSFSDEQYFHEQCEKFIAAWQAYLEGRSPEPGPPPIRRFLGDTDDPAAAPVRHKLFAELLDIDLNYRWEHDIQHAPRLAAYLLEFPEFEAEVKRAFRIGRYEIRGLLGDGAFGRVYRGWDPQLE